MGHDRVSRTAALALALAALGAPTAAAQQQDLRSPDTRDPARAAADPHAHERYYSYYGTPDTSAALAQERYLSSYGEPESLTPPESPVPSDDTPWLSIALSITGALVIVAASATQLRRLRIRRRRAVRTTA
jgi:hypothetical protein